MGGLRWRLLVWTQSDSTIKKKKGTGWMWRNETRGMTTPLIASLWVTRCLEIILLTVFSHWGETSHWWKQIHSLCVFFFYLHLDAGDAALLSPVHGVWYISACGPHKRRRLPLEVSGRTECSKGPPDLLWSLRGSWQQTMILSANEDLVSNLFIYLFIWLFQDSVSDSIWTEIPS